MNTPQQTFSSQTVTPKIKLMFFVSILKLPGLLKLKIKFLKLQAWNIGKERAGSWSSSSSPCFAMFLRSEWGVIGGGRAMPLTIPTKGRWEDVRKEAQCHSRLMAGVDSQMVCQCVCVLASGYRGVPVKHAIPIASDPPRWHPSIPWDSEYYHLQTPKGLERKVTN